MKAFSLKKSTNWATIVIILIACMSMQFVIRHGLSIDNSIDEQIHFVSENLLLWRTSWASWSLAVVCLFIFAASLYGIGNRSKYARFGLLLVFTGLILDFFAHYKMSYELGELAVNGSVDIFVKTEAIAMTLTGVFANMLCNFGGLIITLNAFSFGLQSKSVSAIGIAGWLLGLGSSFVMYLYGMKAAEFITVIAMSLSIVFIAGVNLFWIDRKVDV